MEKELVNKMMEKEFREMTDNEKIELREWCETEEEFDQLKQIFVGIEELKQVEKYTPRAETKKSLDDLFVQKHSNVKPMFWYNTILVALYPTEKPFSNRPLVRIAAIGLIALIAFQFVFNGKLAEPKQQISKIQDSKDKGSVSKDQQLEKIETTTSNKNEVVTSVTRSVPSPVEIKVEDFQMAHDQDPFVSSVSSVSSAAGVTYTWTTDAVVSTHPDGIFTGESSAAFSQPASYQPAIFDLLTTTF